MEQFGEFVTNHLMLFGALAVIAAMLIGNLAEGFGAIGSELSPQQAVQMMNREGAAVIDLRAAGEFSNGHIVGAMNLPESGLKNDTSALEPHRQRPLLLYCTTGMVSGRMARALKKQGFAKPFSLKGGVSAWQQENFPLTRD
jgi:rhodanese-related sulfurtransferase